MEDEEDCECEWAAITKEAKTSTKRGKLPSKTKETSKSVTPKRSEKSPKKDENAPHLRVSTQTDEQKNFKVEKKTPEKSTSHSSRGKLISNGNSKASLSKKIKKKDTIKRDQNVSKKIPERNSQRNLFKKDRKSSTKGDKTAGIKRSASKMRPNSNEILGHEDPDEINYRQTKTKSEARVSSTKIQKTAKELQQDAIVMRKLAEAARWEAEAAKKEAESARKLAEAAKIESQLEKLKFSKSDHR